MIYRIGLDVGSTTAKIAVMDEGGGIIFSDYKRHQAKVNELLDHYLHHLLTVLGDVQVQIAVTGSVGMATAELLQVDFVQEVVTATEFAKTYYPHVQSLIDIGGEDSKVVFFDGGHTDLCMNGNCAGGTGAFIDQMSSLIGIDNITLNDLAMKSTRIYPMAARCGVFAKTDVQNLISQNVNTADVAASIFHSIAVQTVTTLCHGRDIHPQILLCGGPLTFLPALRKAFSDYLNIPMDDFIVDPYSNLIPAIGCAIKSKGNTVGIVTLLHRLNQCKSMIMTDTLPCLFENEEDYEQWKRNKNKDAVAEVEMKAGTDDVVLGIDSGSTTTKIVVARENGDIIFCDYSQNHGNPIEASRQGLQKLKEEELRHHAQLNIIGSCTTGYGEELIKSAFNLHESVIETVAHFTAAKRFQPAVSFILDIGGQDMKAIFVDHGAIVRMELNEACSSGCGTFLQTFASSLNYSITDFAKMACRAHHPCNLGTRCTVFMNSKIKQVLREGADACDISAGLSYSVINNCLHKVLKLQDDDSLGEHVVVQGGTMRNDALVRAFELLTGKQVARSNRPEMMGAYGCSLHASVNREHASSIDEILSRSDCSKRNLQCHGCENQCAVIRYTFTNGNRYYSGNKCERVFTNQSAGMTQGRNVYIDKYKLLFDRPIHHGKFRVGIPRVLNMYEDFPFWHSLLSTCGFEVVLSEESNTTGYESAVGSVMSDNICFPAKLVHSHIQNLLSQKVNFIIMPYVVYEKSVDDKDANTYNCPIVSGYSDVVLSAMFPSVPLKSPVINFGDKKLLRKQIIEFLSSLDVKRSLANHALTVALEAQNNYETAIRQANENILEDGIINHRLIILLAGRPYHTDPLIQHRLSEMITDMGVHVISDDIVRGQESLIKVKTLLVRQWAYMNRILRSAAWAADQPENIQFVEMNSFGCGPDSFLQGEVRNLLHRHNKSFTLLKIDDVSNLGSLRLRIRSLIESVRLDRKKGEEQPLLSTRTFTPNDIHRTILCPHISEFITPLLPNLVSQAGYKLEVLPPSDDESARLGLQYANNEVCYPATLITGDIIKALKSGRYHPEEVAVMMSQTGGQCRATNYAGLIKRAMVTAGFANVPFIALGVTSTAGEENEQKGFSVEWKRLLKLVVSSLFYADTIAKFYYASVVREKSKGLAGDVRDRYLALGGKVKMSGCSQSFLNLISSAAFDFEAICAERETKKVGLVGEIFLKFNHFANQQMTSQLIARGIEVVPPLITPFFMQEFVNAESNQQLHLSSSYVPKVFVRLLYDVVERYVHKINQVASSFRYFRPFTDIYKDSKFTKGIISPAAQFGEGWLLPADILSFVNDGVNNVLSLQPFGCIANQVVARGIEKALHQRCPQLNMLSIDFDSGVSKVNVTNRLLLFLNSVK